MKSKFYSLNDKAIDGISTDERELVEGMSKLGLHKLDMEMRREDKSFDYAENTKIVNKRLMQYAASVLDEGASLKNPLVRKNPMFQYRLYDVISRALAPVVLSTVSEVFDYFAETMYVDYGDSLNFSIPSRDLFQVNLIANGITRGPIQYIFGSDMTLAPQAREVTVQMDWYRMVAGEFDMGDYLYRVGVSFANDISDTVYKTLNNSFAGLPAVLKYSGAWSEAEFIKLTTALRAMTGQKIYAVGSINALSKIAPATQWLMSPFAERYGLMGYLATYKMVDLIAIPQTIKQGTLTSTGFEYGIDDNRIYLLALGGERPVKLGFEGGTVVNERDEKSSADNAINVCTQMRYDAKVYANYNYGIMNLT